MGDQSELNDSKHSEPTAGEGTSKNPSQLDLPDRPSSGYCIKPPMQPKQIRRRTPWTQLRSFRKTYVLPKFVSPS